MLQVGALEGDEELTPLGYHLAKLPVDVLIGKVYTNYYFLLSSKN
jgi:ATP-dependent RNA helicase DHX29